MFRLSCFSLIALICSLGCHSLQLGQELAQVTKYNPYELKPLERSIEAIELQTIWVETDVDDLSINEYFWQDVDQVGPFSAETRALLRQHGFRIGLIGSTPPETLEKLLDRKTDEITPLDQQKQQKYNSHSIYLRSGDEAKLFTASPKKPVHAEISFALHQNEQPVHYSDAKTLFRARIKRLQDGWIKLDLTPEIHHGPQQLRPIAGEHDWELPVSQAIESLYELECSLHLNMGEMIVIGPDTSQKGTLAKSFFESQEKGRPRQRLLIIRLANMKRIDPI